MDHLGWKGKEAHPLAIMNIVRRRVGMEGKGEQCLYHK